jgi:hypothetical protein
MALDATKNFLIVTVSQGYGATDTNIVLGTGQGALLPTPPFNLTWWNATDYPNPAFDPYVEIVRVTNVLGDTITILRNQEGTAASPKNTPGKVYQMINAITSKMITDIDSKKSNVAASPTAGHLAGVDALGNVTDSGYIPPSGNIVGDTDTQSLSNKRLYPRQSSQASPISITPDKSQYDEYYVTALANGILINNAASPSVGDIFVIYLTDNGTARSISFGTNYAGISAALPTTTTASKTMEMIIKYVTTTTALVSFNNQQ